MCTHKQILAQRKLRSSMEEASVAAVATPPTTRVTKQVLVADLAERVSVVSWMESVSLGLVVKHVAAVAEHAATAAEQAVAVAVPVVVCVTLKLRGS